MFVLSVVSVIISSYLILSVISSKEKQKTQAGFLYFWLIAFSQIVVSFEILSLFSAISKNGFFVCNIVFLAVSIVFFLLKGRKLYVSANEFIPILKAIKRDKALMFLGVCFLLFCVFRLITILISPITFGDALNYYLPRCTMWLQQGNILHYTTTDTRELVMPVNMEFLYTWVLMFRKSEIGLGIFSYISFLGAIYVLYKFLEELKFTIKRRLWTVFVFSSFALVIVEMVSPCADLFIGALILSSIYLFLISSKYGDKTALFFSSLSYALAVGTKTTSVIAIPSVFIIFCVITYLYKKETFFKHIFTFGGLFLLNFLIFASYNYILNIIQFHNLISCPEQLELNRFRDGFQGYFANLFKYLFAFFDLSGMPKFTDYISGVFTYWQTLALSAIGASARTGTSNYFPYYFELSSKMGMMNSFLGVMGLFVFLPSVIYALKRIKINKKSHTAIILGALAISFVFNLLLFSRVMLFTRFNLRYILTFAIIAAPVAAYSYPRIKHKLCKIFLCVIMFTYFIGYSHYKPFSYIVSCFQQHKFASINIKEEELDIYNYFRNKSNENIALIVDQTRSPVFYIEKLRLNGFKLDKILLENIESYDFSRFDYIIANKEKVSSTNIVNYKDRIKYPDLFISKCLYNDYRQNTILQYDKNIQPAMVECIIPFEYIYEKGYYRKDKNEYENYIILRRK